MIARLRRRAIETGPQVNESLTGPVSFLSSLPVEPLTRIRPHKNWAAIDLKELWAYRELFLLLTWCELKLRYKQTLLGGSWVILQPLMMTVVFTVFLGLFVHPPIKDIPYSIFLYAGLLPWTFFSTAILSSSYSLVSNSKLIRRTYFPRVLLPLAAVALRLSDFIISFSFIFVMMLYYGISLTASLSLLPLVILTMLLAVIGIGTWFAALSVKYGDVGTILPVLLQICMFASPIVYPASLVPEKWRLLYYLNPMAGIVEGFRASLFNLEVNWISLGISFAVSLFLLICMSFSFKRMEDEFADTI